MGTSDAWSGLVWLALGLSAAWAGYAADLGTANEPGPGAVIFWAGLIMAGLSAATVANGLRGAGAPLATLWAGARWGRVLLVVGALALYAVSLGGIGFLVATPLLLVVLLRAVDPVRWSLAAPIALGAPVLVWWVMEKGLAITLPAGAFPVR